MLASDARIHAIVKLHARMREHHARGERPEYFALNQEIHQALVALADNDTLAATHASLSKRMRSLRYSGNSSPGNWAAALAERDALIDALEARDGPCLARLMRGHIENTWPRIRHVLRSA